MRCAFLSILAWGIQAVFAVAAIEPIGEARVFRYNGPGNGLDQGAAIAAMPDGGAVVVGASRGATNVSDIVVVRMGPNGAPSSAWPDVGFGTGVRRYDGGINRDDRATSVAVGPDGSVYVAGYSEGLNTFDDYIVLKFDSSGALCSTWPNTGAGVGIRRYNRLSGYDQALAVAVGSDGSVFVTGRSTGVQQPAMIVTVKYSPTGVQQWAAVYNGTGNAEDRGMALLPTSDGGVIVGGNTTRQNGRFAYVLLRYNSNGTLSSAWPTQSPNPAGVRVFTGVNGETAELAGIAWLPGGGIVATGRTDVGSGDSAVSTVAWSAAGQQLWHQRRRAATVASDQGMALVTNADGDIFVASRSERKGTPAEIEVLRYRSDGSFDTEWPDTGEGAGIRRWKGAGDWIAFPTHLGLDRLGNLFVAGRAVTGGGISEIVTLKFSSDGRLIWKDRYNGPGNDLDEPTRLAIGGDDTVWVTGRSDGAGTNGDLVALSWPQVLPWIDSAPEVVLATVGGSLIFQAEGGGRPGAEFTYQWIQDGTPVGTGATFSPGVFHPSRAGFWELEITDGFNLLRTRFAVAGMTIGKQNGNVALSLYGPPGIPLVVQSSTNLQAWAPWQTLTHPGGEVQLTVPGAERMFFRLAFPGFDGP